MNHISDYGKGILPAVLCIVILVAESNEISVLKSLVLNVYLSL